MPEIRPWWRHAAVYQVYIRSFADGNGDGVGDIAGLRSRLSYIRSLGVDAVWINPWYRSPLRDGGYDVADYTDIHPSFGTLEEAEMLIAEATGHGLRVLVDLVPNHTSSEHRWFVEALESGPGGPERERYIFRPGRGSEPPTDWQSVFGGPAWSQVPDGDWYLHLFDESQPDLNWANADMRRDFLEFLRFWLDRGVSGFRVDVAHGLAKDMTFPDLGERRHARDYPPGAHPHWDRPELHGYVEEWRAVLDEYPDSMMVAEAWVPGVERMATYLRPGRYHQSFDFEFLEAPWDATRMRRAIDASLTVTADVGSVPTWVLSNHDVVRHATRYGLPNSTVAKEWLLDGDRALLDVELGLRRARAASLMVLALPGSVYLYQGEELGLGEVIDLPPEVLDDPVWVRTGQAEKGRDGCRVPIPWTPDGASFGFGTRGAWLPQPEGWRTLAVASQEGAEGSTLEMYRNALAHRRARLTDDEELEWLDTPTDVIAFRRGSGVRCYMNAGDREVDIPGAEVLIASGPICGTRLPANTTVWLS